MKNPFEVIDNWIAGWESNFRFKLGIQFSGVVGMAVAFILICFGLGVIAGVLFEAGAGKDWLYYGGLYGGILFVGLPVVYVFLRFIFWEGGR